MACKYNDSVTCNRKIWKCEECSIEKCVKAVKDKIVKEIAETKSTTKDMMSSARNYALDRAIEIVRKGGVHD